jgi:signal transduction histidine kinase
MPRTNFFESIKRALFTIVTLALMCASFAAAYGLMTLIFSGSEFTAGAWGHAASGLIGVILFLAFSVPIHAALHSMGWPVRRRLLADTVNVFEKISQGKFDVFIQPEDYGPFGGIAESVNKMARDLDSMEKMRQDFISNVSHEIQSPLTSIRGFAALLKNDGLAPERRDHYLDIIEIESRRLSSLSDNLLRLSCLESNDAPLSKSEYRLDRQIENIALMLEPQWRAKNLIMDAELEETQLYADEELMSEVWINLLHNAVKFTRPGGKIMIVLRRDGGEIRCQISDTGIGIAPEDQMHIFERFYRADRARGRSLGGNGLGLSIVRKIVELHDGRVELESEPLKGSIFRVYLGCPSRDEI